MEGQLLVVRKQDPSVLALDTKLLFVPEAVLPGPSNELISIRGLKQVTPDDNGDFLPDPRNDPEAFDAVHSFAAVWRVLSMFRRVLSSNDDATPFTWQWGSEPIKVFPYYGNKKGAWYRRQSKQLEFNQIKVDGQWIYTCRSFDMVAHETGHAVLDSLKPKWYPGETNLVETLGIHESFADLAVVFALVDQVDICEDIIVFSRADLHTKSFLPAFAEEYGSGVNARGSYLRNADNDMSYDRVNPSNRYDYSRVMTGAVYDILADYFEFECAKSRYSLAACLHRVGQYLLHLLMQCILEAPEKDAKIIDIARLMYRREEQPIIKKAIKHHFEIRGLPVE